MRPSRLMLTAALVASLALDRAGNGKAYRTAVQANSCNETGAQVWDYYVRC